MDAVEDEVEGNAYAVIGEISSYSSVYLLCRKKGMHLLVQVK